MSVNCERRPADDVVAEFPNVTPAFFEVFKIPIVRGRGFTDADAAGAPAVVIVNQALARELWPDGDPVGGQLYLGTSASTDPRPLQIVGVAADVHERTERPSDRAWFPTIYVPIAQTADGFNAYIVRNPMAWMIRTRVEPHTLAAAVKSELLRASGGLPVVNVRSMDEILSRSTAR